MANWSELLPDLLEAITRYLPLSDVNRFSAVCKQWRFIAKQRRYAPVAQLPWMLHAEEPETRKTKLFNMSEQQYYYIDLPDQLHGGFCVGSSFGWLFIISRKLEGYLVNPFTRAHYNFPPLPLDNNDFKLDQVVNDGKVTFDLHGRRTTWKLEDVQKMSIRKAVLSNDPNKCEDFITIIIAWRENKTAFCRPKDNEWTIIRDSYYIYDVICYKGNFYGVGGSNHIYAIDLGPEPKMKMIKPLVGDCITGDSKYLVDFFGKHLLLVHREKDDGYDIDYLEEDVVVDEDVNLDDDAAIEDEDSDGDCTAYHSFTRYFVVFELDLEKEKWHKWNDLGGDALFLGTNRAIALRASEFPDCMADCIYFTSCSDDICFDNTHWYDDLGVYNLIDDCVEENYGYIPNTSLPTWLVPNP
jgi:Protein of unknown function (DUF295)/F-box domain